MKFNVLVYDGKSTAAKAGAQLDTADPEQCLTLMKTIFKAGRGIAALVNQIPKEDKEKLFNFLNDEVAFPDERYTGQVDFIHETLGMELGADCER